MKLIQSHYIGQLASKCASIGPALEITEREKKEMQKREEDMRRQHSARESVKILNFLLSGAGNREYSEAFSSPLAEELSELCLKALRDE